MQNCDIAEDKDILEEKLERKQRGTKTYSQKNRYNQRIKRNRKHIDISQYTKKLFIDKITYYWDVAKW